MFGLRVYDAGLWVLKRVLDAGSGFRLQGLGIVSGPHQGLDDLRVLQCIRVSKKASTQVHVSFTGFAPGHLHALASWRRAWQSSKGSGLLIWAGLQTDFEGMKLSHDLTRMPSCKRRTLRRVATF